MLERDTPADGGPVEVLPNDAGLIPDSAAPSLLCAPFQACGGDLVGTWSLVSSCADMPIEQAGCESLQYTANRGTGTIEFSDAGTYRQDTTSTFNLISIVPADCLVSSCAAFQADSEAHVASSGSGTVTCSSTDGDCRCYTAASTRQTLSGRYSVSGSTVTLVVDPASDTTVVNDYCVAGSQLTLHQPGSGSSTWSRQ